MYVKVEEKVPDFQILRVSAVTWHCFKKPKLRNEDKSITFLYNLMETLFTILKAFKERKLLLKQNGERK